MSFCVGADDSLPENILYKGVKTALAGGLAAAPTSNCVTPNNFAQSSFADKIRHFRQTMSCGKDE